MVIVLHKIIEKTNKSNLASKYHTKSSKSIWNSSQNKVRPKSCHARKKRPSTSKPVISTTFKQKLMKRSKAAKEKNSNLSLEKVNDDVFMLKWIRRSRLNVS
jgi:hypothetical protein